MKLRLSLCLGAMIAAQALSPLPAIARPETASAEKQVSALMETLRADPPSLRAFMTEMPKGGDLHHHLDGSVWAEEILKWADADGDCLDRVTHKILPAPCTKNQVEARGLVERDPLFYRATIDALSMRNFVPGTGTGETNGHDHTFATFDRFNLTVGKHLADALVIARRQAVGDSLLYLETMTNPGVAFSEKLLGGVKKLDPNNLDAAYTQIEKSLPGMVAEARAQFDGIDEKVAADLKCGSAAAESACDVRTKYLFFIIRTMQPEQVFAQIALGFALSDSDPRFVGLNIVAPEDNPIALRDYWLHMQMFRYFSKKYPDVKFTMHSGELWLGLVQPSELGFHIRGAVEVAGASRIGHGYALPFERDPWSLLAEMARKKIALEVNLTSNEITPGVKGEEHPLHMYRKAGVPLVLSADDGGVFRIDLTHEYVRAALEHGFTYLDLKEFSRNGLEYSFLEGASLWDAKGQRVAACARPGAPCEAFLKANEKASAQYELDRRFDAFESRILTVGLK